MSQVSENPGSVGGPPPNAASYESLLSIIRYRRTTRAIDPKRDVSDECVQQVLEAARWAPSAGNGQPWEFIVIRDDEMRRKISELYAKQLIEKREMQEAVWGTRRHVGYTGFRNAPVFVLVLGDPRTIDSFPVRTVIEKGNDHFISSLAQATVLAHLAAASLGLGSQWISDVSSPYMSVLLKKWLDIPRYMKIYDMFDLGYPAIESPVTSRRVLDDIVHYESYDLAKARTDDAVSEFLVGDTLLGGFRSSTGRKRKAKPEGS